MNRQVSALSFGNRKKVSIVAALQHNPTLLILDEPTSGLDPLIQRAFWDLVTQRNNEGTTIFLSSHVLSEVQHHCRHAAIIREGRIVVSDAVESLSRTTARRVTLRGVQELPALPPACWKRTTVKTSGRIIFRRYEGADEQPAGGSVYRYHDNGAGAKSSSIFMRKQVRA